MRWRLLFLMGLIFVRLLGCWYSVLEYRDGEQIKISGKVNIIEQSYKECISKIGNFQVIWPGKCAFDEGDSLVLIGRADASLTERLLGQVRLVDPVIIKQEKGKNGVEKQGGILTKYIGEWRQKMVETTVTQLPEPEAGLTLGVVLGVKTDLEQKFYEELVKSGTVHMVVASGYNLMIVGGVTLSGALFFFKRKWASLVTIIVMFFYAALAGNEPPVIRAAIMGSLVFIGSALGRRSISWWSLILAGGVMVLVEPFLISSISFQLSMAASIGLMVLAPVIMERFYGRGEVVHISQKILMKTELTTTLSTMIMTAPLIWWHFGRLQWVALLSNLVILPLVPILMGVGGVATLVGLINANLARPFYWGVWVVAHSIVELVQIFGE